MRKKNKFPEEPQYCTFTHLLHMTDSVFRTACFWNYTPLPSERPKPVVGPNVSRAHSLPPPPPPSLNSWPQRAQGHSDTRVLNDIQVFTRNSNHTTPTGEGGRNEYSSLIIKEGKPGKETVLYSVHATLRTR